LRHSAPFPDARKTAVVLTHGRWICPRRELYGLRCGRVIEHPTNRGGSCWLDRRSRESPFVDSGRPRGAMAVVGAARRRPSARMPPEGGLLVGLGYLDGKEGWGKTWTGVCRGLNEIAMTSVVGIAVIGATAWTRGYFD